MLKKEEITKLIGWKFLNKQSVWVFGHWDRANSKNNAKSLAGSENSGFDSFPYHHHQQRQHSFNQLFQKNERTKHETKTNDRTKERIKFFWYAKLYNFMRMFQARKALYVCVCMSLCVKNAAMFLCNSHTHSLVYSLFVKCWFWWILWRISIYNNSQR